LLQAVVHYPFGKQGEGLRSTVSAFAVDGSPPRVVLLQHLAGALAIARDEVSSAFFVLEFLTRSTRKLRGSHASSSIIGVLSRKYMRTAPSIGATDSTTLS